MTALPSEATTMKDRYSRYLSDTVQTASPAQLVVMLYDRLLLDVDLAAVALSEGERAKASAALVHAQDIVAELMSTLNLDAWDGARELMSIYNFLLRQLVDANVGGDAEIVRQCRSLIAPLRETWTEAAASLVPSGGSHGELGIA